MFVLRMCGVADAIKVFGIAWRTADVFRRTTTGGLEQEGKSLCRRVVEPFFELDHMVPAVEPPKQNLIELPRCVVSVNMTEIGRLHGKSDLHHESSP